MTFDVILKVAAVASERQAEITVDTEIKAYCNKKNKITLWKKCLLNSW